MRQKQSGFDLLVVVVIAVGLFGFWRLWLHEPAIAAEDRLLEWIQVIFLASAALVSLARMIAGPLSERVFPFGFLFLVFLSALLREVDVEDLPLPDVLVLLGSGPGRNIMMAIAWIVYLFLLLRRPSRLPELAHGFLTSRLGIYFTTGVLCYLATIPFDKKMLGLSRGGHLFAEEALEVAGTLLLFLATLWRGRVRG